MTKFMVWLENKVFFSSQKAGKRSSFSETLAGISTLTQWAPWYNQALCDSGV